MGVTQGVCQQPTINVLSLTGGGYRGLYSARVLQLLEERAGKPIGQCFDLVAGTSIGGILALAVAFEVPMKDVVAAFLSKGSVIFRRNVFRAGLFRNKYDSEPVADLLEALLPRGARLADAKHALIIPALNLTLGRGTPFKSRHNADWTRDYRLSVRDVALATSAAPIYFPIASFGKNLYADGGLFANAPDLVALHEANTYFSAKDEVVRMLSIGTMSTTYVEPMGIAKGRGLLSWLRPTTFPLIQTILAAQEQMALQIVRHRLGSNHLRLDESPSQSDQKKLGLNIATDWAQQRLLGAAEDTFGRLREEEIEPYLAHSPQKWIIAGGE
ncbi:hypothetical protein AN993_08885 [Stenotrophomonas maltophilia]|uniref:CBASS cGAMP-activated phospholipase n=1 Tax=Stenotrophomonas maltophilia TaxID=40324 RepID=UPI0006CCF49D|nr:CBASS cGAMP-activated phospholipase [Stenotrophomonas maltophilia]KPG83910.1 hypothetical protein AN993_08885 [Stenotrophomonas maltophilia]MBA0242818.1 hypothetical protein [Stenotrophomonas maltophilia]MBA0247396.1 hypothetical protein [Stenotrophomonas maltophilia]MBA0306363.1 hypothetical protein [Stenotrophomonas maltophilia]MBA0438975.1 hypothetical protein [Stenotrophomonas maltophilia]